ncbi:MAG: hypothetical protein AAEJ52_01410 [Myxococcota bacterium]
MSDWLKMTRRRCLTLIVGSMAVVCGSWPSSLWSANDRRRREAEAARWRRQLRSPASAAVVGSAYLAAVPQTETELIADLAAAVGRPVGGVLAISDVALGLRLRDGIRSDYGENRTVRLRGWTVSRTEAQLCAMYALADSTA